MPRSAAPSDTLVRPPIIRLPVKPHKMVLQTGFEESAVVRETIMSKPPAELLEIWLNSIRHEISPKTRQGYVSSGNLFITFLAEKNLEIVQIDNESMTDFKNWLFDRKTPSGRTKSAETVASYGREVSVFLKWLHERQETETQLRVRVKTGKKRLRSQSSATDQEYKKMLEQTSTTRDRLLLEVAWSTGARLGEITSWTLEHLIIRSGSYYVLVRERVDARTREGGSGAKTGVREIKLPKRLYLELEAMGKKNKGPLWLGLRRDRFTGNYEAMSESGLEQVFFDLSARAGLRRVGPQMFRRAFARRMRDAGMPQHELADLMGNSSSVLDEFYREKSTELAQDRMLKILEREQ